jgi:sugar/nucleoside kinase (ribokinase family)
MGYFLIKGGNMSLVVVGSVALDSISNPHGNVENVLGGSACYFSCSASYFTKVNMVGVAGKDFPVEHIEFLESKNIDTKGLEIVDGKTFHWKGKYEGDLGSAETLSVELNVFQDFNPVLPEEYKKAKYVFLANIAPALQKNVLAQVEAPELVIMDTMNHWIDNCKEELLECLKLVNVFVLNEDEAKMLTGKSCLLSSAKDILKMGPSHVIIKKGADGVFLMSDKDYFATVSYPVYNVIDTTGAGDTFAGGVVGYLAKTGDLSDDSFRKAVVYGSVMASFTVEDFSLNRIGAVKQEEIDERFNDLKKITDF